jgi:hypothetical protein
MTVSGTGDRAIVAREIRRVITDYRDSHTMATVFGVLNPLATLLWDYDAPAAYLLRLASQRMWSTVTPLPANVVAAFDPASLPNSKSGSTRWMPARSSLSRSTLWTGTSRLSIRARRAHARGAPYRTGLTQR